MVSPRHRRLPCIAGLLAAAASPAAAQTPNPAPEFSAAQPAVPQAASGEVTATPGRGGFVAGLGAVTTTATRSPLALSESPATVSVIDREQMERENMTRPQDSRVLCLQLLRQAYGVPFTTRQQVILPSYGARESH